MRRSPCDPVVAIFSEKEGGAEQGWMLGRKACGVPDRGARVHRSGWEKELRSWKERAKMEVVCVWAFSFAAVRGCC